MEQIRLENEQIEVTVNIHGAELRSLKSKADGQEYLWNADAKYWGRTSPVLFPFVGGVKNKVYRHEGKEYPMNQHGFARDMEFSLVNQSADEVWFALEDTEETYKVYPFHFHLEIGYRLEDASVSVMWKVKNINDKEMHFAIGAHPAFFCPMEEGELFTDYMLRFEDENVPDLHLQYPMFDNDAILYENLTHRTVRLISSKTEKGIQFDFPGYESVAFWTPIKKDAPFLCIEPWCGGTMDQVSCTDMLKKKYVQFLDGGKARDYVFRFQPC